MSEKPSEEMLRIADEKYDTDLEDFEESESARYWAERFAELEARLDDSVPSSLHEELRQVMLGERRRAEQAERERDEARRDCAQLSSEFGLPPTIRPTEGEVAKWMLELRAWRVVAEWLKSGTRPRKLHWSPPYAQWIAYEYRYEDEGPDGCWKAPTITELADALKPGWRE